MHWLIAIEEARPGYVRNCVRQRGFVLAAIKRVVIIPKGFPFVKIAPLDCSYQDLVAQRQCLVSGRELPHTALAERPITAVQVQESRESWYFHRATFYGIGDTTF